MPEFHKILDLYQGYDYKKDKRMAVGFITRLKLGDTELKADQTCKNPMAPEEDLDVVAVLTDIMWEMGATDAIYLSGQISVENKQSLRMLLYASMTNIECELRLAVFDYDPARNRYHLAFHGNGKDLKGLLEKRGDELNLAVSEDASTEVQSPLNYAFQVGIKPQPEAQVLHLATAGGNSYPKAWGLSVSG